MKRIMLFAFLIISMCGCRSTDKPDGAGGYSPETGGLFTVAVGIVPEAAFVEAVTGGLVNVVTLIPPGYSPENYQTTATEMQALSDAKIYFTLQMPTEQSNILPKVIDFNKNIKIVDLRKVVSERYPLLNTDGGDIGMSANESVDPHIWLSPKRVIVMVQAIADELSVIDEANSKTYQANAAGYITKLEALNGEILETVSKMETKSFLIYHASYGYFASDYGLTMVAIEIGGKHATAEELQGVIDYARENDIKTIFYQEEFDNSQAETVAQEIGGVVEKAAPLSADYIHGMKDFADALIRSGE